MIAIGYIGIIEKKKLKLLWYIGVYNITMVAIVPALPHDPRVSHIIPSSSCHFFFHVVLRLILHSCGNFLIYNSNT